jgi:methyltransferase family protein
LIENSHQHYLEALEERAKACGRDDLYLWPRTPIETIQNKIEQRVGANDYEVKSPISRPARIISFVRRLIQSDVLGVNFSALDIACGDGIVLWQMQKAFPNSRCYGIDCNKGNFASHAIVESEGVRLYKGYIQHLFTSASDRSFDVIMMLNTYRDWKAADLRVHETNLPELADRWFESNGRYLFLTVEQRGYAQLERRGFSLRTLGKGEDRSVMICASKDRLPRMTLREIWKRSWEKWRLPIAAHR